MILDLRFSIARGGQFPLTPALSPGRGGVADSVAAERGSELLAVGSAADEDVCAPAPIFWVSSGVNTPRKM